VACVRNDETDRREVLRRSPSYGPDWGAAIGYGIDVAQVLETKRSAQEKADLVAYLRALLRRPR
jgi:hypothetical protein